MLFSDIMPAVARGEVDAGLIIHEGRFTYPSLGLHRVLDLGAWWEERTGLPLPLGGILIRRSLGGDTARFVEAKIRESISYARARPHEAWPYVREHAQEMEPEVIQKHIDTFVNDFTLDMGGEGERAVAELLQAAARFTGQPVPAKALFAGGNESGRFEIKNANNPPTSQERIK
jgi:1,4-dihydroxy-6-naphthoate synthase